MNEIRLDIKACIICGLTNLFIEMRVGELRTERDSAAAGSLRTWKFHDGIYLFSDEDEELAQSYTIHMYQCVDLLPIDCS